MVYIFLLALGAIQGLTLSSVLLVRISKAKEKNYAFILLLVLISLALISKIGYSLLEPSPFLHIWFVADIISFSVGPLWFLTIKGSLFKASQFKFQDKLVLVPILGYLAFLVFIFSMSVQELEASYIKPWYFKFFHFFCISVLVVNSYFLIRSIRMIQNSRSEDLPLFFLRGQYAFLIVLILWTIAYAATVFISNPLRLSLDSYYNIAFMSLSFLLIGFAYLALLNPSSYYFLTRSYDLGSEDLLKEIALKIEQAMHDKKPFLDSQFSLKDLGEIVEANPVQTSRALNKVLSKSFSDFINGFRVQYFLQLVKEGNDNHLTHWAIARKAGFGSKMAFYRGFKKAMGTTPKSFLDQA